jgi:hypothetical protein
MGKQVELTLSVPTTLGDITLGQYQRYMKLVEQNKDDESATDFLNMKLIEIFCNVELKDVMRIPVSEVEKVLAILGKAFEERPEIIRHFKLLDVDMGFIPNLERISLGEYIDAEDNISEWETMHKAMAVLYRPVNFKSKERYSIAPYDPSDEVSELMKEMPLSVAMSAMVFFYDLAKELLRAIPNYIQKSLTEEQTYLLKQTLAQSGDGISQYMDSLKEMSFGSMPSQKANYSNASTT